MKDKLTKGVTPQSALQLTAPYGGAARIFDSSRAIPPKAERFATRRAEAFAISGIRYHTFAIAFLFAQGAFLHLFPKIAL